MLKELRPAVVLLALLTVITGLAYPFAITGIAQLTFPFQANGSLLVQDGQVIGSSLMGQNFTAERYFHGRPSATTAPDPNNPEKTVDAPYNAASTGGSNLGPTSKVLIERMRADVERLKAQNPGAQVP